MIPNPIKLLLVEDNKGDARLLQEHLRDSKTTIQLTHVERLGDALERLKQGDIHIVLLDLSLPDAHGLDTVIKVRAAAPTLPIVVMTGLDDETTAVEAVAKGAQDYLVKGTIESHLLTRAIRYAIERSQLLLRLEQSSEERFQTIIEKSADGMVVVDANGVVQFVNPAAMSIFNRTKEEIVGQPFWLPLVADERKEWELTTPQGESKLVEVRVTQIEWAKTPALLASIRDVTELKRVESLKAEVRERERLDQLKDEFVGVVSHELRTPLTVIKGSIDNLKDGVLGTLNKKQETVLNNTSAEIERLTRLINDLLDLSRLESGKARIQKTQINPSLLIQGIVQNFQPLAESRKVVLAAMIEPSLPDLYADEDLMVQVLHNLLNNALKFAREKVIVHARKLDPASLPPTQLSGLSLDKKWIEISINDDGPGIAPERIGSLFSKFVQLDRTIGGSGYKGTGLGLAICKDIIELHGGRIWVESTLHVGSQFRFALSSFDEESDFWMGLQKILEEISSRNGVFAFFSITPTKSAESFPPEQEIVFYELEKFMRNKVLRKTDIIHYLSAHRALTTVLESSSHEVPDTLKRIQEGLAEFHRLNPREELSFSFQVKHALYPEHGADPKTLFQKTLPQ